MLYIKRTIGMGDTAFALAAVESLVKQKGDKVCFVTTEGRSEWVKHCTCISEVTSNAGTNTVIDLDNNPADVLIDRCTLMHETLGAIPEDVTLTINIKEDTRWTDHVLFAPFGGGFSATRSLSSDVVEGVLLSLPKVIVLTQEKMVVFEEGEEKEVIDTTEFDVVRLIKSCKRIISVDTGPAHLAALLGKPTTIVFTHVGADSRAGCYGENVTIIEPNDLDCYPCGDFNTVPPCKNTPEFALCANAVSVDQLIHGCGTVPFYIRDKNKIDVLFVVPYVGVGGAETRLRILSNGFTERGITNRVISTLERGGKTADAIGDNYIDRVSYFRDIALLINQLQPKALIFHHDVKTLQAIKYATHKPNVVIWESHTERDDLFHLTTQGKEYITNIVASSKSAIPKQSEDFPVDVIWNSVDVDWFDRAEPINLNLKGKLVGAISRFDDGKRLTRIIDAVSMTNEWSAVFVGDGPTKQEMLYLMDGYNLEDRVKIIPSVLDVAPYYKALDLVILPTESEGGLSNSIIEAMVAGVPTGVTDVSEFSEVFKDGEEIFILPDGGILDIYNVLNTDRKVLKSVAKAGQKKARQLFSKEVMIDKYLELLKL